MPLEEIREFLAGKIEEGEFPSAAFLFGKKGQIVAAGAVGHSSIEPVLTEASTATIYDLASLTKPLITGLLYAIGFAEGTFSIDDPAGKFIGLPDDKKDITLLQLLSHTSGFQAWRPFYLEAEGDTRDERVTGVTDAIARSSFAATPGERVIYSDLNYLLLGFILEKAYGERTDRIAFDRILGPLGLQNTVFNPGEAFGERIAASEKGNRYERETAESMGFDVSRFDWRKGVISGEVHDGNCSFLGGAAGHAGLFADAADVFELSLQFLPGYSTLLEPSQCDLFCEDLTPGLEQARSVGFMLAATPDCSAPDTISRRSFGHNGFTGTSLWIDPEEEAVYILLTNRTHGNIPPFPDLKLTRRRFVELAAESLKNDA